MDTRTASGGLLWVRRHYLGRTLLVALIASGVSLALTSVLTAGSCEGAECRSAISFWVPVSAVVAMLPTLALESELERVVPRSSAGRRVGLAMLVTMAGIVVSGWALLSPVTPYGALASTRNVIGLVGLVLLGCAVLPKRASWVPLLTVVMLTAFYAAPWHPSRIQTVWGFLRQPGGMVTTGGLVDLSWPTAIMVFLLGLGLYATAPHPLPTAARHHRRSDATPRRLRGVLAQLGMPWAGLALLVGVMLLINNLRGQFANHLGLFFTDALTDSWFAIVPGSVAVGCWVGQVRSRSGLAAFDRVAPRSLWESLVQLMALSAAAVASALLTTMMLIAAAMTIINALNGVSVGTTLASAGNTWWRPLLWAMIMAAVAAIATIVGVFARRFWVVPILTLVVYLAQFSVAPLIPAQLIGEQVWQMPHYSVCQGTRPTICAEPINAAYLPAARVSVAAIYAKSGIEDSLPRLVLISNNAPSRGSSIRVEGRGATTDLSIIGLRGSRDYSPPGDLGSSFTARSQLSEVAPQCLMSDEQRLAARIPEDVPDPAERIWLSTYFAAARACDVSKLDALLATKPR